MNKLSPALVAAAAALALITGLFWYMRQELAHRDALIAELRRVGPGVSETMIHIQNHAARVWFAGGGEGAANPSWPYAEHGVHEIDVAFERMAIIEPTHEGVPMTALYASFRTLQLKQLEKAIAAKDQPGFVAAYDAMISACNACHAQAGHAYVVIQRPTQPPASNQRFSN